MSRKIVVSPDQWQLLKRLDAAGCPISWRQFETPCDPIRLIQEPPALGTELFAVAENVTLLAVRLKIVASRPFAIKGLALRADWLVGSLTWLLTEHAIGCFPERSGGEIRFAAAGLLNMRIIRGLTLKAGEVVSGYVAGFADWAIPASDETLAATLVIKDQFDRGYPYDLNLMNSQQISSPGDRYCGFVSPSQLEQEETEPSGS